MDPLEVARQLTLIEDKLYKFDFPSFSFLFLNKQTKKIQNLIFIHILLFRAIPPFECLNQRWAKKNKEKEAPHILAMIDRFNQVCFFF